MTEHHTLSDSLRARVLKVEREWLIHGIGEVTGEPPFIENPDETFVAKGSLKASPSQLRIMHVEGDSMSPTLLDGDTVLVDMTRRAPNPPGIFVLDDGMGLVAKRLEYVPNSDPPSVRVISDNGFYSPYKRSAQAVVYVRIERQIAESNAKSRHTHGR